MTNDLTNIYVLVTSISLPLCCRAQSKQSDTGSLSSSSSLVLHAQLLRTNSEAGLSYVVWKCTSLSASSTAQLKVANNHSQWIPQDHVCIVQPALPNASKALGRSPYDSSFEDDNPHVALWSSIRGSVGRFTTAKVFIHKGERAFQAIAFAALVRQNMVLKRCHWCFKKLRKKALQCGACEFARYCSRTCLDTDATLHDFQCQALRELKHGQVPVKDVETVRLVLAVLSMEQAVRNPQALRLLAVHQRTKDSEQEEMNIIVKFIVQWTKQGLDSQHVRATLERVKCNAHPLYLDGITCVGTGIFPEAAMALNHSCMPNVAPSFDPHTRTLAFHAILEIPQGTAVEYAYIDLLQSRKKRQSLLLNGFGFECNCGRCTNERACSIEDDTDEEESRAMEQLMQVFSSDCCDKKQQLLYWKKNYEHVLKHSIEAQFAFFTAEMQLARTQCLWVNVINAAERLLKIWTRCGLPECYHTTETLHFQIYMAAMQAGMLDLAQESAQKVKSIRLCCGYSHPETSID
ncbi:Predicted histone tail methylase containing SET domain [Plasmopara halstedii]|uniref:Predicted histone tail methylase containing SET domain n=1 Tax=Plasmopara halstedii TaxID=4781 RepID=A0A0P1AZW5_PLAHL|nr:Predicted histone tail methylase containing SET domain [Plasmopara halstedii]CEG47392.1 Predicted histone tail methylase containing SET domain [Plasmopara halstedii]|eukprot:XP_024583761.1 Predicted histone tail methylase containing SET domain [Plasmopara halstedii]